MSIENIKLENLTVFKKIEVDFVDSMNIIIGENGTGKTHLMKLIYILLSDPMANGMLEYFKVKSREELFHHLDKDAKISLKINGYPECNIIYSGKSKEEQKTQNNPIKLGAHTILVHRDDIPSGIFIPAKDMLTHSKGFMSMYEKFDMPFDKSHYDIISKSLLPNLKEIPEIGESIIPKLENIIGGKVVVENDIFYIKKPDGDQIAFSLEAEGVKKIAILWQLIMNESITNGSVLFWDEPEANINPSLYKDICEILLELSRNGVQIFLATHNYNFAKYMEVLSEDSDNVSYHSLYKTDEGVRCETETKFTRLSNNALREDNINLYDAEMKKEFEE